jgi:hypothetical protein
VFGVLIPSGLPKIKRGRKIVREGKRAKIVGAYHPASWGIE